MRKDSARRIADIRISFSENDDDFVIISSYQSQSRDSNVRHINNNNNNKISIKNSIFELKKKQNVNW